MTKKRTLYLLEVIADEELTQDELGAVERYVLNSPGADRIKATVVNIERPDNQDTTGLWWGGADADDKKRILEYEPD